jgi:YVTN family beta-propeller protein
MRFHAIGRCAAVMAMALALSIPAAAQTQVYVLDEGTVPTSCSFRPCYGPTVHLINAVTGHDLGSILAAPLGQRGTSMRLSSDGAVLFVTSNSFTDASAQGRLSIVDALTKAVLAQVTVGVGAADVAILPDNSRAYVVNTTSNSVSVVDLSSFTVVATVTVQSAPTRIVAAPDGLAVYVTNRGSGTVSKITTTTNSVAANIAVGSSPRGLDISPDGSRLFVANSDSSTVSVIDGFNDSVLRTIPAGSADAPPQDVAAQSATRVFVTISDVASTGSAALLLNAADGAVIGSAAVLAGARLARDSSGTPAYVVETGFNEPTALRRLAADGASATVIAAGNWVAGAVVTDPCAFEATATATVFGPSGGTGTLTIPAPAGCSWTIDPSGFSGLSVAAPLSGTGPGTRAFTVPSSSIARLGTVGIRRQTITLEQTIPRMNVEFAPGGAVRQEPFTITGWAIDENAFNDGTVIPSTGVDQVHVWAYPAGGAAPILVGLATYGVNRPDIAALFGAKYQPSGFSIRVSNLPTGTYTLAFFAHSNRSNTFSNVQTVTVSVQQAGVQIAIDRPSAGVVPTSSGFFFIAGWAVDTSATTGPGIDVVHVWAYPASGAAPIFLGQAAYGGARPDVAAYFGSSFTNCGYGLSAALSPGDYTLVVFARSAATKQFGSQTVRITVQ